MRRSSTRRPSSGSSPPSGSPTTSPTMRTTSSAFLPLLFGIAPTTIHYLAQAYSFNATAYSAERDNITDAIHAGENRILPPEDGATAAGGACGGHTTPLPLYASFSLYVAPLAGVAITAYLLLMPFYMSVSRLRRELADRAGLTAVAVRLEKAEITMWKACWRLAAATCNVLAASAAVIHACTVFLHACPKRRFPINVIYTAVLACVIMFPAVPAEGAPSPGEVGHTQPGHPIIFTEEGTMVAGTRFFHMAVDMDIDGVIESTDSVISAAHDVWESADNAARTTICRYRVCKSISDPTAQEVDTWQESARYNCRERSHCDMDITLYQLVKTRALGVIRAADDVKSKMIFLRLSAADLHQQYIEKRGLFGGIASIFNWAYTTAELRSIRNQMKAGLTAVGERLDEQALAISSAMDMIKTLAHTVKKHQSHLNKLHTQLQVTANLDQVTEMSHRLDALAASITNIWTALIQGRVTPDLFLEGPTTEALKKFQDHARGNGRTLLVNSYQDLLECKASYTLIDGKLEILVHIPAAKEEDFFELHVYRPFPILDAEGLFIVPTPEHRMVAANRQKDRFMVLNQAELASCATLKGNYLCKDSNLIYDAEAIQKAPREIQCIASLLGRELDNVQEKCTFTVQAPFTTAQQMSASRWAIATAEQEKGEIVCDDVRKTHYDFHVSGITEVVVKPGCTATVAGIEMMSPRTGLETDGAYSYEWTRGKLETISKLQFLATSVDVERTDEIEEVLEEAERNKILLARYLKDGIDTNVSGSIGGYIAIAGLGIVLTALGAAAYFAPRLLAYVQAKGTTAAINAAHTAAKSLKTAGETAINNATAAYLNRSEATCPADL